MIEPPKFRRKRRSRPRLPWKRGPKAYEIAQRADSILKEMADNQRGYYSLRRTAKVLGVSTQPVRDWIQLGQLHRDGPRRQTSRAQLEQFVQMLRARAEPFDKLNYLNRIREHRKVPIYRWRKLSVAKFDWPKGRTALTPSELAKFIGCHPSLIRKAISRGEVRGHWRTRCRWAITRHAWRRAFSC